MAEHLDPKLVELKDAVAFFDRVAGASDDEKIAVGHDHWDRLEAAARAMASEPTMVQLSVPLVAPEPGAENPEDHRVMTVYETGMIANSDRMTRREAYDLSVTKRRDPRVIICQIIRIKSRGGAGDAVWEVARYR